MKTKTKIILVAIAVIPIIAFTAYILNKNFKSKTTSGVNQELESENQNSDIIIEGTEEEKMETLNKVIKRGSISECDKIKDDKYKEICKSNIVFSGQNVPLSACDEIEDGSIQKKDCVKNLVYKMAIERKDVSLCSNDSYPELQSGCEQNFYIINLKNISESKDCEEGLFNASMCKDYFLLATEYAKDIQNKKEFNCDLFETDEFKSSCTKVKSGGENCDELNLGVFKAICS